MARNLTIITCLVLALAGMAQAQLNTGTTSLSVTIGPEASLTITDSTTTLATSGTTFANPFTGTTNLSYMVRTTKSGGGGAITAKVTTDFGAGGPSVGTPPTAGDALTYDCTVAAPGSACTGPITASTGSFTSVATFGPNAKSPKAGASASVGWSLTNDPLYETGTFSATVTFTISAT